MNHQHPPVSPNFDEGFAAGCECALGQLLGVLDTMTVIGGSAEFRGGIELMRDAVKGWATEALDQISPSLQPELPLPEPEVTKAQDDQVAALLDYFNPLLALAGLRVEPASR